MSSARLDHAILAVRDLDEAGAEIERRFGLGSVAGGSAPRLGHREPDRSPREPPIWS